MPSRRLLGCVVGLMLALTACGNSTTGTSESQPQAGSSPSPTADSTPMPEPTDCGTGQALDLESALRIVKDGPDCAGATNRFWREQLGDEWTEPKIISYDDGDIPDSECAEEGTADEFADNAFYCPLDDVIAFSNQLMDRLIEEGGPYLPVVVLQHELGHRANNLGDMRGVVSRAEENQADCQAGASTRFARESDRLPRSDVLRSAKLLFELGDVSNFGSETADDPGAHGTPTQRLAAYARGFFQGIEVCDDLGRKATGEAF